MRNKPGPKPKSKVKIQWSPDFAYAIGLLTTDGCLSKDRRHIDFTSKDEEQILNFLRCLNINSKISTKKSGYKNGEAYRVQLGDVNFYKFLLEIGLHPRKSRTLKDIKIPEGFFFDFLRGHFDGDGTFYSYWDPRWKSSFMFYLVFISASYSHIIWIRKCIFRYLKIQGHITQDGRKKVYHLKYAKMDSIKLLQKLYPMNNFICLGRKYLKIKKALMYNE
ncbi:LAGLIDADG family homing endonuclease [Candidatus Peregrinibacteria bacterium]|nr:LAGLIDADG family homing endonuclease [Candidatus Peregrinibacteria bacterium]